MKKDSIKIAKKNESLERFHYLFGALQMNWKGNYFFLHHFLVMTTQSATTTMMATSQKVEPSRSIRSTRRTIRKVDIKPWLRWRVITDTKTWMTIFQTVEEWLVTWHFGWLLATDISKMEVQRHLQDDDDVVVVVVIVVFDVIVFAVIE